MSFYLYDANDTLYLAEPAGVWDGPDAVYLEHHKRPDDAVPLYRLTVQPSEGQTS